MECKLIQIFNQINKARKEFDKALAQVKIINSQESDKEFNNRLSEIGKAASEAGLKLSEIHKVSNVYNKLDFSTKELENMSNLLEVFELSNEDLEKTYTKIKEERKRRKDISNREMTTYFKEDTQEITYTPISKPNCYYVGELKHKVIKRIEELLKHKNLSYSELMALLKRNKKFKYVYDGVYGCGICEYFPKKDKPTLFSSLLTIKD